KTMEAKGIKLKELPGSERDARKGFLVYPSADGMAAKVKSVVDDLRAALAKPDADVLQAAADFQQSMVALHPFQDSNGRTSRIVMNRILAEYDLPPAILDDPNNDLAYSPSEWKREIAEGCARSKKFLESTTSKRDAFVGYAVANKINV